MKLGTTIGVAVVAVSLAACTGPGGSVGPKTAVGGLGGAAAGGLIGAAAGGGATGIAAGAILGGLLGGAIGSYLDEQDRQYAAQNAQRALENTPSGTTSNWSNPDNGHRGTFTPQPGYRDAQGRVCREGTNTVWIEGRQESVTNTYCRRDDGVWELAS